jgi:hypothetical protein
MRPGCEGTWDVGSGAANAVNAPGAGTPVEAATTVNAPDHCVPGRVYEGPPPTVATVSEAFTHATGTQDPTPPELRVSSGVATPATVSWMAPVGHWLMSRTLQPPLSSPTGKSGWPGVTAAGAAAGGRYGDGTAATHASAVAAAANRGAI